jgi:spermidine/putrescine-binding protein
MVTGSLSHRFFSKELTIHTWIDYFSESIVEQFEEKSGHNWKYRYFYSDIERDITLSHAGVDYDVVLTDLYSLPPGSLSHLFQSIDPSEYPNFEHLDPDWVDSCGNLGVSYLWGGVGIAPMPEGKSLAMAQVYSGGAQQTFIENTGQQDWEFVYPKEGAALYIYGLSISWRIMGGDTRFISPEFHEW